MVTGLPLSARNLILTGYRETNQPRVGRLVAEQLGMPFVDVEAQIEERMGNFVSDIRSEFGERRLKAIEDEVLADVSLYRRAVIRIGGSALTRGDHLEIIPRTGVVVCLVTRLDALLARLHLTMGARYHNPAERAVAIGELEREWAIRKHEGVLEIDITDDDEAETIDAVVVLWRQIGIERG
jgi:shikimate kinase